MRMFGKTVATPASSREWQGIVAFLAVIWGVFLVDAVTPLDLARHGVVPRTAGGLLGIPLMPFLHASFQHLASNTIPLFVLLVLLVMHAGSQTRCWGVVAGIVLLGGGLLWVGGRAGNHIGASELIFGLIAFLVVAGVRARRFVPLIISIVVSVLYGGTLLWGVLPRLGSQVSWDGHLAGAVAGVLVALAATGRAPAPESPSDGG